MNSPDYRALLARHGGRHWWTSGMRAITQAVAAPLAGRVLDVGSGPGWELAGLPAEAWGVGIDLAPAKGGGLRVARGDASALPFPSGTFDIVLALDLLEQDHVDPKAALAEIVRVLRPGGRLFARVPAHPSLLGPRDAFWGTARRYRRADLGRLVTDGGLEIRRLTYANGVLFPLAFLARVLGRRPGGPAAELVPPPAPANRIFAWILECEARWLRRHDLPVGLSLLCLAELPLSEGSRTQ